MGERVHHPNATANGPHLDAIVDDPGRALIYVESKWLAGLGAGAGAEADTLDDQMVLRRDSLRKDPALSGDDRCFVVLGVSQVHENTDAHGPPNTEGKDVRIGWLTWR